jgi:hypothetical protein
VTCILKPRFIYLFIVYLPKLSTIRIIFHRIIGLANNEHRRKWQSNNLRLIPRYLYGEKELKKTKKTLGQDDRTPGAPNTKEQRYSLVAPMGETKLCCSHFVCADKWTWTGGDAGSQPPRWSTRHTDIWPPLDIIDIYHQITDISPKVYGHWCCDLTYTFWRHTTVHSVSRTSLWGCVIIKNLLYYTRKSL